MSDLRGQEVTFLVRRSLAGRLGWKIMPEDETVDLKVNCGCVDQVMQIIRWALHKIYATY